LHSFSALHARNETAATPLLAAMPGADDETTLQPDDPRETSLAGAGFGNAVHAALEAVDPAQWRLQSATAGERSHEDRCPPNQRDAIERALLRQGLTADPAAVAQTARLVHRALNVRMPDGARLCDAQPSRLRREMGFHFRLRSARLDDVYALLDAHGYPRAQRPAPANLEGFMHGYIDLVYRDAAGRHYVVDYKTNRLPGYDAESLRLAVRQRDYDLQYLIYLVALRRWLRLRRGAAFDPKHDLGGAVYLFLRGIVLRDDDLIGDDLIGDETIQKAAAKVAERDGVFLDPVSPALLAALDALFDGGDGLE
jgi:exodeoxyribonuclease V beta subunit